MDALVVTIPSSQLPGANASAKNRKIDFSLKLASPPFPEKSKLKNLHYQSE
jgi:hypothetical protein